MVAHYAITVHIISSSTFPVISYIMELVKVKNYPYLDDKGFTKIEKDFLVQFFDAITFVYFRSNISIKHRVHLLLL